jgi:hypothetical protein
MKKQPINKAMFTNVKWKHYPTIKCFVSPGDGHTGTIYNGFWVSANPSGGKAEGFYTASFFSNGGYVGSHNSPPYDFFFTYYDPGVYTVKVQVTGSAGDAVESEPVSYVISDFGPGNYSYTMGRQNPSGRPDGEIATSPSYGTVSTSAFPAFRASTTSPYFSRWTLPSGWTFFNGTNQYSKTIWFQPDSGTRKTIEAWFT